MGIFYGIANLPNLSTLAIGKLYLTEVIAWITVLQKGTSNLK
jgi:hypothetical protein